MIDSIDPTATLMSMCVRLNCAASTVRTGAAFYAPFGIEYSEFVAQDEQGYNIMPLSTCFLGFNAFLFLQFLRRA